MSASCGDVCVEGGVGVAVCRTTLQVKSLLVCRGVTKSNNELGEREVMRVKRKMMGACGLGLVGWLGARERAFRWARQRT